MRYLIAFLFFSHCTVFASDNNNPEYMIFIGNPGSGKSTILNSIVEQRVFESGISTNGLTKKYQTFNHNDITYIDTPGLADTKIKNQAIEEIEKALKLNGFYTINFVLTLSAGRIKPQDVDTINRVMSAINDKKLFNVIFNKVTKQEKKEIFEDSNNFISISQQINSGGHVCNRITYLELDYDMEDELKDFLTIDESLIPFLQAHSFFLDKNNVGEIISDDIKELKRVEELKKQEELKRIKELKMQEEILKQKLVEVRNREEQIKQQKENQQPQEKFIRIESYSQWQYVNRFNKN